jgi:hypothetical protein
MLFPSYTFSRFLSSLAGDSHPPLPEAYQLCALSLFADYIHACKDYIKRKARIQDPQKAYILGMTRRKTGISCFVSKAITESCVRDEWSEDTRDEGGHINIFIIKKAARQKKKKSFVRKNFFAWLLLMDLRNVLHVPFASRFRHFLISFSFYIKTLCCV